MESEMGQPYAELELWHVLLERNSNECKKGYCNLFLWEAE